MPSEGRLSERVCFLMLTQGHQASRAALVMPQVGSVTSR